MASLDDGASLHPLLASREKVERVGVILMTADRGLCGGFNANPNRAAKTFIRGEEAAGREVVIIACGKKGRSYLKHADHEIFRYHEAPTFETLVSTAKAIATEASTMFTTNGDDDVPRVDRWVLIYNYFKNVLTQEVRTAPVLPFPQPEVSEPALSPVFEPEPKKLLEHLVPVALESLLQQAMFNSIAAEIAARRMAMDAATDNASELISDLTLEYNRERQAAITKELMEIIGGAEALKG
ncbi:MAG: ATP synthase F1 subunit gamma, partial [Nannocystaceae bacterium]